MRAYLGLRCWFASRCPPDFEGEGLLRRVVQQIHVSVPLGNLVSISIVPEALHLPHNLCGQLVIRVRRQNVLSEDVDLGIVALRKCDRKPAIEDEDLPVRKVYLWSCLEQ